MNPANTPPTETHGQSLDLSDSDVALILDALGLWAAVAEEGEGVTVASQALAARALSERLRLATDPPFPAQPKGAARQLARAVLRGQ